MAAGRGRRGIAARTQHPVVATVLGGLILAALLAIGAFLLRRCSSSDEHPDPTTTVRTDSPVTTSTTTTSTIPSTTTILPLPDWLTQLAAFDEGTFATSGVRGSSKHPSDALPTNEFNPDGEPLTCGQAIDARGAENDIADSIHYASAGPPRYFFGQLTRVYPSTDDASRAGSDIVAPNEWVL